MLRTAFMPDFKWCDTLLIWGDNADMAELRAGLVALRQDQRPVLSIEGGARLTHLEVRSLRGDGVSRIMGTEEKLVWSCSWDVLSDAIALIEPLTTACSGHQYIDAQGDLAELVTIAVNEYPESLRR